MSKTVGRPKTPEIERRNIHIALYITKNELKKLNKRKKEKMKEQKKVRKSTSEFVRDIVLETIEEGGEGEAPE